MDDDFIVVERNNTPDSDQYGSINSNNDYSIPSEPDSDHFNISDEGTTRPNTPVDEITDHPVNNTYLKPKENPRFSYIKALHKPKRDSPRPSPTSSPKSNQEQSLPTIVETVEVPTTNEPTTGAPTVEVNNSNNTNTSNSIIVPEIVIDIHDDVTTTKGNNMDEIELEDFTTGLGDNCPSTFPDNMKFFFLVYVPRLFHNFTKKTKLFFSVTIPTFLRKLVNKTKEKSR